MARQSGTNNIYSKTITNIVKNAKQLQKEFVNIEQIQYKNRYYLKTLKLLQFY